MSDIRFDQNRCIEEKIQVLKNRSPIIGMTRLNEHFINFLKTNRRKCVDLYRYRSEIKSDLV